MSGRPALVIVVRLEDRPSLRLDAESYDDEQRLRLLLRGPWFESVLAELEALREWLAREAAT